MSDQYTPKTESQGSSAQTAIAVGAGAVIAAVTAPIWVPVLGLGAVAAAIGTGGVAAAGGALGWWLGGKK